MLLFKVECEVPSHSVKKNNRPVFKNKKTGQVFLGKSDKLRSAEGHLEKIFQLYRNKFLHGATIETDVHVKFTFIFKDYYTQKMKRSRFVGDLDNLLCLPLDILVKSGVLLDDSFVCSFDGSRRKPGDKNMLIVEIFSYE